MKKLKKGSANLEIGRKKLADLIGKKMILLDSEITKGFIEVINGTYEQKTKKKTKQKNRNRQKVI